MDRPGPEVVSDRTGSVWALSFRQPYAGLVLAGLKTLESRWRPLLAPLEGRTLAVHVAWRDWEDPDQDPDQDPDWRVLLVRMGFSKTQIRELLESGERYGRGVVAGLVDVGRTWLCPPAQGGAVLDLDLDPDQDLRVLQGRAVLTHLGGKFLTQLSRPRWLRAPLACRGGRDLWALDIPPELLP
ncbi:protein EOLA1 isoform 1-T2 [Menidia menidia]